MEKRDSVSMRCAGLWCEREREKKGGEESDWSDLGNAKSAAGFRLSNVSSLVSY